MAIPASKTRASKSGLRPGFFGPPKRSPGTRAPSVPAPTMARPAADAADDIRCSERPDGTGGTHSGTGQGLGRGQPAPSCQGEPISSGGDGPPTLIKGALGTGNGAVTAVKPGVGDWQDGSGGFGVSRVAEREERIGMASSVWSAKNGLEKIVDTAPAQVRGLGESNPGACPREEHMRSVGASNPGASQQPKRLSRFKQEQLQRRGGL